MQEIIIDRNQKAHCKPNPPAEVSVRVQDYECSKYCRLCPFPGLKCCAVPDVETLSK